jgi:acyl-phosphate glycerol 3-phosphate acyltransferase
LLGEERVIVSDVAGTTRDAIDSLLKVGDQEYRIIDTAGMRKRNKIDIATERYSVIRALKAIDRSDVVLMLFDAKDGITEQDKKIAGYVHESGKSCILVFNKWDLVEKDDKTLHQYEKKIRAELLFLQYAPIIFISAATKQRVGKILELIDFVAEQQNYRASTSALNEVIQDAVRTTPIPTKRGKRGKILYATQINVKPPTFVFFVNDPELIHFTYERYLENKLREAFGFEGTPIWLKLKKREENNPGIDIIKVIVAAYILGSIPFGYYMGKFYGIDVRKNGSGNIGFTNVWRLTGPLPALIVLFFDAGKGWLSVYYGYLAGGEKYAFAGAILSLVGHLFPLFLNFKGGKGVATGFGICLFIDPLMTSIALILFLIVVYTTRYVSAGSITAALTVMILSIVFDLNFYYKLIIIPAALAVIYMHKENIKRLLNGNENKIGKKGV